MNRVKESWEITRDILTIVDEDRTLVPGEVYGQPFLTRYDLFYDPVLAGGDVKKNYNKIMEDIFSYSDGSLSLFDIANRFNYRWEDVRFLAQGLVDKGLFSVRRP